MEEGLLVPIPTPTSVIFNVWWVALLKILNTSADNVLVEEGDDFGFSGTLVGE